MDIIGVDALRSTSRWDKNGWVGNYLYAFSQSIGGGTSEIQRNIVGDRVLGLPR
jgi:alkylation response protein AidB-like acyl-CoA dehydrogenase